MDYSARLVGGITWSPQAVNLVAGCSKKEDCTVYDNSDPGLHFTVESWSGGILQVEALPSTIRPIIASVLDYNTYDGPFIWAEVVNAGMNAKDHLALNFYTSYNANFNKPFIYFDPWTRLLEVVPQEIIVRCSDITPGSTFYPGIHNYLKHTTDPNITCHENDSVWFSPACRGNTTECIPMLIQYDNINMMQQAFWLSMPVALLRAKSGTPAVDAAYYAAVRRGNFLFGWYTPDDSLVDGAGALPLPVGLPPTSQREQEAGIFRTGLALLHPQNFAWRYLAAVDRRVQFLAAGMNLAQDDLDDLMRRSRALRDDGWADDDARARRLACDWVAANAPVWRDWIPAQCPARRCHGTEW